MKTRKELMQQLQSINKEHERAVREIEEQLADQLPKQVVAGQFKFSPDTNGTVDVRVDSEEYTTIDTMVVGKAIELRDMLLALHPLDTAPDAGWVSVKERLPPNADVVLCYTDGDFQHTARYRMGMWKDVNLGHAIASTVTHWRKLPSPPVAKGGRGE